jgi:hypothetical protein
VRALLLSCTTIRSAPFSSGRRNFNASAGGDDIQVSIFPGAHTITGIASS